MAEQRSRGGPAWFWGALCAVLLILISTRGQFAPSNEALHQVFAAQPPPPGLDLQALLPNFDLSKLPPSLQTPARDLLAKLDTGQPGVPVEATVTTPRLQVTVRELRPVLGNLLISGEVTNVSKYDVVVPLSAFVLQDSAGLSYRTGNDTSTTLGSGEHIPLDLTIPLPVGRGLLLTTNFPPDAPVEQRLIVIETPAR